MVKEEKLIKDPEVTAFIEKRDYSGGARKLLESQRETWNALATGYASLNSIKTKTFQFDGFSFIIQFNPGRIISTSASTDDKSIKERKCFLCSENLPAEQKGILINNYLILANPFPIFSEHFTIPSINHIDQRIKNNFGDLVYFTKLLSENYFVFYNGPQCGASAPDHLHFQAGNKSAVPFNYEYDIIKKKYGETLISKNDVKIIGIYDGLRKIICFESNDREMLLESFDSFYNLYALGGDKAEPMMNIISRYEEQSGWRISVMLRAKHRPEEFYKTGEERILFSPAGADFGGLCITPLESDFERFNKELLIKIFNEVSINGDSFNQIKKDIKAKLG